MSVLIDFLRLPSLLLRRFKLKTILTPTPILAAFFGLVFLIGGSAQPTESGVPFLRASALFTIGCAALTLRFGHLRRHRATAIIFLAMILLVVSHLIPLPYGWWSNLPGRELIVDIDRISGLGEIWRPLTISPSGTLNALMSLTIPAAVFVLGVQLDHRQHIHILLVILSLGIASLGVGLAQASDISIHLYEHDSPLAGLFANRNHQSLLLAMLFPMAAAYARLAEGRYASAQRIALVGVCLVALPLILVTGSRSGLFLMIAGLGFVPWLLGTGSFLPQRVYKFSLVIGSTLLAILTGLTIWASRDLAIKRLEMNSGGLRWPVWESLIEGIPNFMPWGTGVGSYAESYQMIEPEALLRPTFSNHAHNEFLEILFTAGLPGVIILGAFIAVMLAFARRSEQDGTLVVRQLGLVLLAMIGMASLTDYPSRTPIFLSLITIFSIWVSSNTSSSSFESRKEVLR